MDRIITLLALKPILYGFIGMMISGLTFPVAGVIVVQNGLIPLRYMLMHGVILGGVIAIALGLPMLLVVIPLNILLVLLMMAMNRTGRTLNVSSTEMMVFTMGLSSLIGHIFDVPSKDTLEVLWGSPFALTEVDLILLALLGIITVLYIVVFFKPVSMLFFDKDIALSLNVPVERHNTALILLTSLVISVAMRVLGALLIDALLVLPVVGSEKRAVSLKGLFIRSAVTGFVLSFTGYILSLLFDLPVSGVLALLGVLSYALSWVITKINDKRSRK